MTLSPDLLSVSPPGTTNRGFYLFVFCSRILAMKSCSHAALYQCPDPPILPVRAMTRPSDCFCCCPRAAPCMLVSGLTSRIVHGVLPCVACAAPASCCFSRCSQFRCVFTLGSCNHVFWHSRGRSTMPHTRSRTRTVAASCTRKRRDRSELLLSCLLRSLSSLNFLLVSPLFDGSLARDGYSPRLHPSIRD